MSPSQLAAKVHDELDKLLLEYLLVPPTIEELQKIAQEMGVVLSLKMANQALFYSRDYSSNEKLFKTEALIKWFCENVCLLRSSVSGNNFKVRRGSSYRNTEAHTVIGGSTVGLGG